MKKSLFKKLMFVLMFFASIGCLSFSNQKVNAAVHSDIWWSKPHRVVVINKVKAYQIFSAAPLYQPKRLRKVTLQPGQSIKIRHVLDFGTLVTGSGFKFTENKRYSRFWAVNNYKDWWYMPYAKIQWVDKGLLMNSYKEEHVIYRFNWNQMKVLASLGAFGYDNTKRNWQTRIKPLVDSWHVKIEKD